MAAINNYPGGTGAFSTSVRDISNGLQDSVEDGVAVRPTIIGAQTSIDDPSDIEGPADVVAVRPRIVDLPCIGRPALRRRRERIVK